MTKPASGFEPFLYNTNLWVEGHMIGVKGEAVTPNITHFWVTDM